MSGADKENAIRRGLLSLLQKGRSFRDISVAEVAAAAGIGKGTVYEYYASKEEMICAAVLGSLREEVAEAMRIIVGVAGFKQKFMTLLDLMKKGSDNMYSGCGIIVSSGSFRDIPGFLKMIKEKMSDVTEKIEKCVGDFVREGAEEGVIAVQSDAEFVKAAIVSALAFYGFFLNNDGVFFGCGDGKARQMAYDILVKALN